MFENSESGYLGKLAKGVGYLVLGLIGIVIIANLASEGGSSTGGLKVVSHEVSYGEYGNPAVTGIIENTSNESYSYVQVSVNIYKGDTQVSTTMANTSNLQPGRKWKYEAHILQDVQGDFRYEITEVTGF
jgi:hypothetical protein